MAIAQLNQESLWYDEGWSMWAVHGSLLDTLERVALDVHPPLYFVALNAWFILSGEAAYSGRMLSLMFGILGVVITYQLGRTLFDHWVGIIAMLLLGSSSFFIYYTREIRMYTLLLSVAVLSMWVYIRWLHQPVLSRFFLYSITIALLPYIHYYGALITLTQGLHLLLFHPQRLKKWLLACTLALGLYLPWTIVLSQQIQTNPAGPLALPVPTNLETITWLLIILGGGSGLWLLTPFFLGSALSQLHRYREAVFLLILWLIVSPLIALTLNAWVVPIYHVRYIIAILPAFVLLVAYGIRHIRWRAVMLLFLVVVVYNNLTAYSKFWPPKEPWEEVIKQSLLDVRQPDEPLLLIIKQPYSLEAYYTHQLKLQNVTTLDLSSREADAAEIQTLLASLDAEATVWVMMPHNLAETWLVMATLAAQRHIGYRNSVAYMLIYRFEYGYQQDLSFYFGDQLRYEGDLFTVWPLIQPGSQFCTALSLTTLQPLEDTYSVGVHLVDTTNQLVAQVDQGLGVRGINEQIQLNPCLNIPTQLAPGEYQLHLLLYSWPDGKRLPLYENSIEAVFWGDALVFGGITVLGD